MEFLIIHQLFSDDFLFVLSHKHKQKVDVNFSRKRVTIIVRQPWKLEDHISELFSNPVRLLVDCSEKNARSEMLCDSSVSDFT